MPSTLEIVDGVPHIHGQRAIWDDEEPLIDAFSQWRCPICRANLSAKLLICLNACHLTEESREGFRRQMAAASRAVRS